MFKNINTKYLKYFYRQNFILISLVLCLLSVSILNLTLYLYLPIKTVEAKQDNTNKQVLFWNNFMYDNPTYFKGWIELSNLKLKQGNLAEAKYYYGKAFEINPNSDDLAILKIKLGLN
jgi:hypothetical protein